MSSWGRAFIHVGEETRDLAKTASDQFRIRIRQRMLALGAVEYPGASGLRAGDEILTGCGWYYAISASRDDEQA